MGWTDTIQVGMKVRHYKGQKEAEVVEMWMDGEPTDNVFKNKSRTMIKLLFYEGGTIRWRRRRSIMCGWGKILIIALRYATL